MCGELVYGGGGGGVFGQGPIGRRHCLTIYTGFCFVWGSGDGFFCVCEPFFVLDNALFLANFLV